MSPLILSPSRVCNQNISIGIVVSSINLYGCGSTSKLFPVALAGLRPSIVVDVRASVSFGLLTKMAISCLFHEENRLYEPESESMTMSKMGVRVLLQPKLKNNKS